MDNFVDKHPQNLEKNRLFVMGDFAPQTPLFFKTIENIKNLVFRSKKQIIQFRSSKTKYDRSKNIFFMNLKTYRTNIFLNTSNIRFVDRFFFFE